jgi:hypothetical protein
VATTLTGPVLDEALGIAEDLLLDHAHTPFMSDDESSGLRAFEAIATTAIEDGKGVTLRDGLVLTILLDSGLNVSGFAGDPAHPAVCSADCDCT